MQRQRGALPAIVAPGQGARPRPRQIGAGAGATEDGGCTRPEIGLYARHFTGEVRAYGGDIPAGPPVAPDHPG